MARPIPPSTPENPERPSRKAAGSSIRRMETVVLVSAACLLAAVAWPIATGSFGPNAPTSTPEVVPPPADVDPTPGIAPSIQIALVLDTSSSMDGLIDQARTELWRVVNALDTATFQGETPRIEIALFEYGNDNLSSDTGWIRQVMPFTSELDKVSAALFSLTTMGGTEHGPQVIHRAVDELRWRDGQGVLKVLYVAGNEQFDQGPMTTAAAVASARAKGIVVNTINCSQGGEPDTGWLEAAKLAGGTFLRIDHNAAAQHIAAPQDDEIARLGREINDTYVHYGSEGASGYANQAAQDGNAAEASPSVMVQRSITKGSKQYDNSSWDLVDAIGRKKLKVDDIDKDSLPSEYRGLSGDEIALRIEAKTKDREALQVRLGELAEQREAFLDAERRRRATGDGPERLDDAIIGSIRAQAVAAGFTLDQA